MSMNDDDEVDEQKSNDSVDSIENKSLKGHR